MGKTHIVFGAFALLGLGFGACSMFSPGAPGNNAVATLAGIAASKNTTVQTLDDLARGHVVGIGIG